MGLSTGQVNIFLASMNSLAHEVGISLVRWDAAASDSIILTFRMLDGTEKMVRGFPHHLHENTRIRMELLKR